MDDSFIATKENPLRVLRNDAIAISLLAVVFLGISWGIGAPTPEAHATLGEFAGALSFIIIVLRRVAPITALWCTSIVAGAVQGTTAMIMPASDIAVLMAVYAVAAFAPRRFVHLGFVSMVAALAMLMLQIHGGMPWVGSSGVAPDDIWSDPLRFLIALGIVSLAFLASWALGMNRRNQLAEVNSARERAALLERDQQRLTELAVADERTRISREMHDIIAHSLASIVTLAEGGRLSAATKPELGGELFTKISTAGRDALGDIKVLLRTVDSGQEDTPVKGVGELRELVDAATLAGVPIEFIERGRAYPLPKGLSLAVFRVGQECLTNMYKHAPGARAELELVWKEHEVRLRAFNERTQNEHAIASDQRGLTGMRERTELFDGTLTVNESDTAFEVVATWPTSGADTSEAPHP